MCKRCEKLCSLPVFLNELNSFSELDFALVCEARQQIPYLCHEVFLVQESEPAKPLVL